MAELKTARNRGSVAAFLTGVEHAVRREDAQALLTMMEEVTGEPAEMWGADIVGFGSYRYRYRSGREGEWFLVGFSPRKANLTLYIMADLSRFDALLSRLGKHRKGKSCLYVNRLSDVDRDVLRALVAESVTIVREREAGG